MNSRLQRIAHRGGARLAPENTLAAFRNALTTHANAIELDIQMSRDGHAIVFHDSTVERLTDGEGNILDLDFAYLRSLNAAAHFSGGWPTREQIPTLYEVLELARNRVRVYIEMKASERDGVLGRYPNIAETVVKEVSAVGMLQQVLIISFDWTLLPLMRFLEPVLQTGAIVARETWQAEDDLETLVKQVQRLGASWINMDRELFTPAMPAMLHQHSLKLGLWTVNTIDDLRRFTSAGVDSLTTDRPDLFADL